MEFRATQLSNISLSYSVSNENPLGDPWAIPQFRPSASLLTLQPIMNQELDDNLQATFNAVASRLQGSYTLASTADQCTLVKLLVERLSPCPPIHIITSAAIPHDTSKLLACLQKQELKACPTVRIHLLTDDMGRKGNVDAFKKEYANWTVRAHGRTMPVKSDHLIVIGESYVLNDFSERGLNDLRDRVDQLLRPGDCRDAGVSTRDPASAVYVDKAEINARVLELIE